MAFKVGAGWFPSLVVSLTGCFLAFRLNALYLDDEPPIGVQQAIVFAVSMPQTIAICLCVNLPAHKMWAFRCWTSSFDLVDFGCLGVCVCVRAVFTRYNPKSSESSMSLAPAAMEKRKVPLTRWCWLVTTCRVSQLQVRLFHSTTLLLIVCNRIGSACTFGDMLVTEK